MNKLMPIFLLTSFILTTIACSCSYLPPIILNPEVSKLSGHRFHEISCLSDGDTIIAVSLMNPGLENKLLTIAVPEGHVEDINERWSDFSLPSGSPTESMAVVTVSVNEIWLLDVEHANLKFLTKGDGAIFSRDGSEIIIYVSNLSVSDLNHRELRYIDLQGKVVRTVNLEFDDDLSHQGREHLTGLSLSPDEKYLLISLVNFDPEIFQYTTYVADTRSGEVVNMYLEGKAGYAHWSPDGSRLAYINVTDDILGEGELVIADREGNCLYKPDIPAEVDGLTWSPDCNRIAFLLRGAIYILDLETLSTSEEAIERCQ